MAWVVDYHYRLSAEDVSSPKFEDEIGELRELRLFCTWDDEYGFRDSGGSFAHAEPTLSLRRVDATEAQLQHIAELENAFLHSIRKGKWQAYTELISENNWDTSAIKALGYLSFTVRDRNIDWEHSGEMNLGDVYIVELIPNIEGTGGLQRSFLAVPSEENAEWMWVLDEGGSDSIAKALAALTPKS